MSLEVFASHVAVYCRPPVATITGTSPVIDIENSITIVHQEIMEHVFPVVITPPFMGILKVTRTMDENDPGPVFRAVRGKVEAGRDLHTVGCPEMNEFRYFPVIGPEGSRGGTGDLHRSVP